MQHIASLLIIIPDPSLEGTPGNSLLQRETADLRLDVQSGETHEKKGVGKGTRKRRNTPQLNENVDKTK